MSHILHCGDGIAGMAAMGPRSVSAIVTDPPYSAYVHATQARCGRGGIANVKRDALSFAAAAGSFLTDAAAAFAHAADRWVVLFCDQESVAAWKMALETAGLEYIRTGAWVHPDSQPQFTGDRPAQGHDAICIAHRPGKKRWNGGGRHAIWTFDIVKQDRLHETQKPLGLIEALVHDFSDAGELVADPFSGSCTTGAACKRLGRRFIGWEIDPGFYEVGKKRLDAAREQFQLPRMTRPRQLPLAGPDRDPGEAA